MFNLISCIILTLSIVYADTINLLGTVNDCNIFPQTSCTVLYLPTQYFVVKSKCIGKIIKENRGMYINYQNLSLDINYIIKDDSITYLYPNKNQLIKPINYYMNDIYISFNISTYNNYILYGYIDNSIVNISYNEHINDDVVDQLFSFYNINNKIIFNEFNTFPSKHKIININYKTYMSCKKNNLLIYDPEIYDNSCKAIYF